MAVVCPQEALLTTIPCAIVLMGPQPRASSSNFCCGLKFVVALAKKELWMDLLHNLKVGQTLATGPSGNALHSLCFVVIVGLRGAVENSP